MTDALERLRDLVLDDPGLCRQLLTLTSRDAFKIAVAQVAESHGLAIGPAEVEAALVAAQREWFERWV